MLAGGAILTISSRQHLATPDMWVRTCSATRSVNLRLIKFTETALTLKQRSKKNSDCE